MKKTKIKKDLFNRIKEIGSGSKIRGITLISMVISFMMLIGAAGLKLYNEQENYKYSFGQLKIQEGNWDMTLFTCTYSRRNRLTLRFELVNEV